MIAQDQHEKYQEELDKITYLLDDFYTHHEKWAVTTYTSRKGKPKTKFEPVTTSRFIEPLLGNKIVVLMSATLPKEGTEAVIECDSPFPVEVRPWEYKPLGRMSYKCKHVPYYPHEKCKNCKKLLCRGNTIPRISVFLSKLEGKTLVHAHSYDVADKIYQNLLMLGKHPFIQNNNDDELVNEDVVKRNEAVKAFKESQDLDKILISVKLDRGVDFFDSEIVNNVVACLAFPNKNEPLVKAKNSVLGEEWQAPCVIADIEQKYGRIHRNERLGVVRGEDVVKKTWIVDSNFGWFYQENGDKFHGWFTSAQVI